MKGDPVHAVDDVPADDSDCNRKEGDQHTNGDVPGDDGWAGLPDELQDRGHIFERAQAVAPTASGGAIGRRGPRGRLYGGFLLHFRNFHGQGGFRGGPAGTAVCGSGGRILLKPGGCDAQ